MRRVNRNRRIGNRRIGNGRIGVAAAFVLVLVAATACIPQPPPGRGPNPTLTVTSVVADLDHPWDLAFASAPGTGTWMLYTERAGRLSAKQLPSGAPIVLGQLGAPFVATGEGGLLGLAVDPGFATNRFVYACYTTTSDVRLVRFTVNTFTPGALAFNADVVTGMLDVRDTASRLPEVADDEEQLADDIGDAAVDADADGTDTEAAQEEADA